MLSSRAAFCDANRQKTSALNFGMLPASELTKPYIDYYFQANDLPGELIDSVHWLVQTYCSAKQLTLVC